MNNAAVMVSLDGKYDMKHFVKDNRLNDFARHARSVKNAVEGDGFMRGIVMAKDRPGGAAAPPDLVDFQLALKETLVQRAKDFLKIVMPSLSGAKTLVPARSPRFIDSPAYVRSHGVGKVAGARLPRGLLPVIAHNQHFRQRLEHNRRRIAQDVKHLNLVSTFIPADGATRMRPLAEVDLEPDGPRPGTQAPVDTRKKVLGARRGIVGQRKLRITRCLGSIHEIL